jgi:Aspartyl protease
MTTFHRIACFVFAATLAPALQAKPHCPGSVTSLHFHPGHGSQIIAPVMINHTGPYDFLVDTGAEVTIVDSSLAESLRMSQNGGTQLVGISFQERAAFAQTDSLEMGSQAVTGLRVLVWTKKWPQAADLKIRGILGGDFLSHFDMLIDNAHRLLCLDSGDAMRQDIRGGHVDLEPLPGHSGAARISQPPVIAVHLSGLRASQLLLIDSGANVPLLYGPEGLLRVETRGSATLRGGGAGGGIRAFAALPPQEMQVGSLTFRQVSFLTLRQAKTDQRPIAADGVLTTGIFRRVFISYSQQFAVVEPW